MIGAKWQYVSLPRLFELRPRVLQRYRAVEHQLLRRRVRVDGEIAEPLELVARAGRRPSQTRLDLRTRHDLERVGVEVRLPVLAIGHVLRVWDTREVVVESNLRAERVRRTDPVDRALHLAPVGRIAAARGGVVGAVNLGHVA